MVSICPGLGSRSVAEKSTLKLAGTQLNCGLGIISVKMSLAVNLAWLLLLEDQRDKVRTNRCWGEEASQISGQ